MSGEERKPILQDSGVYVKASGSNAHSHAGPQQHLIIQPIEFDHKHKNWYGYLALAAFVLVLINYLMIKERSCKYSFVNGSENYDLIQSFHMTVLIVAILVFVLSYFDFAEVIYELKLLFYTSAALIFTCTGLLLYNTVAIASAPCVPANKSLFGLLSVVDSSGLDGHTNVFSARDGIGVTVFLFDIFAAGLMFFSGRKFYQRH